MVSMSEQPRGKLGQALRGWSCGHAPVAVVRILDCVSRTMEAMDRCKLGSWNDGVGKACADRGRPGGCCVGSGGRERIARAGTWPPTRQHRRQSTEHLPYLQCPELCVKAVVHISNVWGHSDFCFDVAWLDLTFPRVKVHET